MLQPGDQDDPLDWSIDRVIEELCLTPSPSWITGTNIKPFHDPITLERVLRDNDIDGDALLNLDETSMRTDLGIGSFGQRHRLKQIISVLRRLSQKFEPSDLPPDLKPQLSHEAYNGRASFSSHGRAGSVLAGSPNIDLPSRLSRTPVPRLGSQGVTSASTSELQVQRSRPSNLVEKKEAGLLNELESHLDEELSTETRVGGSSTQQNTVQSREYVDSSSTKRRRIAPENISTQPLTSAEHVTTVSNTRNINEKSASGHHHVLSHQTQFISADLEDRIQQAYKPRPFRNIPAYKKLVNAKLVKAHNKVSSSDVSPRTEFYWEASRPDTGSQRIAAKHIKATLLAVRPGLESGRKPSGHKTSSVNLLHTNAIKDKTQPKFPSRVGFDDDVSSSLPTFEEIEPNTLEGGYQRLLEQYPADVDDDVLPLYGQSDEEDRYVTDGSISDADSKNDALPVTEPAQLSSAEVDTVIDEAIKEFKADWLSRKLPKIQQKAHGKWMLAFRVPGMRANILKAAQNDLDSASRRLPNLRSAYHDSVWTKAAELKQLCDSLSATIDLIEESNYYVQVLESEQEPTRPSQKTAKRPRAPRNSVPGEVNCSSDEDDINNFIIDGTFDESGIPQDPMNTDWNPRLVASEPNTFNNAVRGGELQPSDIAKENNLAVNQDDIPTNGTHIIDVEDDSVVSSIEVDRMNDVEYDLPRTPVRIRDPVDNTADADDEAHPHSSLKRTKSAKKRVLNDSKRRNPLPIPPSFGFDDSNSDLDSDLDRASRLPRSKFKKQGRSTVQPIDLTMSSPPNHSPVNNEFEIRTPELNAVDSKRESSTRILVNSNPEPFALDIPELPEIQKTLDTKWKIIQGTEKRPSVLALAKSVYLLDRNDTQKILVYIRKLTAKGSLKEAIRTFLSAIQEEDSEPIRADILKQDQEAAGMSTLLFLSYIFAQEFTELSQVGPEEAAEAWNQKSMRFDNFRTSLLNLLQHWLQRNYELSDRLQYRLRSSDTTDEETGLESEFDTATDIDYEGPPPSTQGRGRGRPKGAKNKRQSAATVDIQRSGKKRMAEQSRLKIELTRKLRGLMSHTGTVLVPINFKEPIVYVHNNVAPRLRPHQVEGIQFMWRELVEDPKHQGGLLAHTMGLGKTMQVITVLSTIAQCNKSTDPKIVGHIPKQLRNLRVLVLCPPTLIANWYQELILWLPNHDTLGPIYRVGMLSTKPYWDIKQWAETGGVLLLAYNRLVSCCKETSQRVGSTVTEREQMSEWLLKLPNVVVADEAHMLKNPTSKTSLYANKIVTHSRLALTGSPLSNHLEEYWAMIDFIAPKYLGEKATFQSKFVKPIELSLKEESNPYERRIGLKKLHVLKRILAPKVHRADITALAHDLPSKTEFYITVPLTELQKEAYTLFVHHFRKVATQEAHSKGNILVWIAMLSLLLNHPFCFVKKLQEEAMIDEHIRNQVAQSLNPDKEVEQLPRQGKGDDDDAGLAEDVDISEDLVVQDVAAKAIQLFEEHRITHSLDDPALSHRCLLVKRILEEALKLGEKTLIFSHSIPTLNYLARMLQKMRCQYDRIDGSTNTRVRQDLAVNFNTGNSGAMVFLISTRAGGLGLNLQGATRVIVFDYGWNPSWEEQAIGRAFRMGQKKPVFVYRIRTGGTYENITFNTTVFKTQLFSRVVDHKSILRKGTKKANADKYLFDPEDPEQKDFSECIGKDSVLDCVLDGVDCVRSIELTETFTQDIEENLTPEEELEANQELESERLQLTDPIEWSRQQRRALYSSTTVQVPATTQGQAQAPQKQQSAARKWVSFNDELRSSPNSFSPIQKALSDGLITAHEVTEATHRQTIPQLLNRILTLRSETNDKENSHDEVSTPSRKPRRYLLNQSQLQQSMQQQRNDHNSSSGESVTGDQNTQNTSDQNAPGCQSQ